MVVQHKHTGGGHFNALINLDGRWLKYDGLDHTGDGFIKIARPRDFADNAFRTDSVTYTIKTDWKFELEMRGAVTVHNCNEIDVYITSVCSY